MSNLDELFKQKAPEIMKEFAKAPWDYKIFSPMSFEDTPTIYAILWIGKQRIEREIHLTYNFATNSIEVKEEKIR